MFEILEALSPDAILGLMAAFRDDPRAQKIDLGVGVYRDEQGNTPILKCVSEAERRRFASETTKTYIGPPGTPGFNELIRKLMFGGNHTVLKDKRVAGVQTPGGCGALRVGAELVRRCGIDQPGRRQQADQENDGLGSLAGKDLLHAQHGHRQVQ